MGDTIYNGQYFQVIMIKKNKKKQKKLGFTSCFFFSIEH